MRRPKRLLFNHPYWITTPTTGIVEGVYRGERDGLAWFRTWTPGGGCERWGLRPDEVATLVYEPVAGVDERQELPRLRILSEGEEPDEELLTDGDREDQ
jgi:hypothetical protein